MHGHSDGASPGSTTATDGRAATRPPTAWTRKASHSVDLPMPGSPSSRTRPARRATGCVERGDERSPLLGAADELARLGRWRRFGIDRCCRLPARSARQRQRRVLGQDPRSQLAKLRARGRVRGPRAAPRGRSTVRAARRPGGCCGTGRGRAAPTAVHAAAARRRRSAAPAPPRAWRPRASSASKRSSTAASRSSSSSHDDRPHLVVGADAGECRAAPQRQRVRRSAAARRRIARSRCRPAVGDEVPEAVDVDLLGRDAAGRNPGASDTSTCGAAPARAGRLDARGAAARRSSAASRAGCAAGRRPTAGRSAVRPIPPARVRGPDGR